MDTPDWVGYVQAGATVVAFGLMFLGARRGISNGTGDFTAMRMPLIWTGLGVWGAFAVFNVVAALVWFGWFRFVASLVTLVVIGFIYWMAWAFPKRQREREARELEELLANGP